MRSVLVLTAVALVLSACSAVTTTTIPASSGPSATIGTSEPEVHSQDDQNAGEATDIPVFEGTLQEMIDAYRECFRSLGYDIVQVGPNAYKTVGLPDDREVAEEISDTCTERVGYQASRPVPGTADEIRARYRELVDLRACLIGEGYDLPPAPSEAAFVEGFPNVEFSPWNDLPDQLPESDYASINKACPYQP